MESAFQGRVDVHLGKQSRLSKGALARDVVMRAFQNRQRLLEPLRDGKWRYGRREDDWAMVFVRRSTRAVEGAWKVLPATFTKRYPRIATRSPRLGALPLIAITGAAGFKTTLCA